MIIAKCRSRIISLIQMCSENFAVSGRECSIGAPKVGLSIIYPVRQSNLYFVKTFGPMNCSRVTGTRQRNPNSAT